MDIIWEKPVKTDILMHIILVILDNVSLENVTTKIIFMVF